MRKILMLSFANIRKTKGHTVSILLMFVIAAMLLNLGLLVFLNFGSYFGNTAVELNASDVFYLMPEGLYSERVDEYIENNDNIKMVQKENSMWLSGTIPYNNDTRECVFLFSRFDENRELSKWKFVGEHLAPDTMSLYVPYVLSVDGGYRLNDKLQLTIDDKIITFSIKGFTEDIFFSSLDTAVMGSYLPHDTYERVQEILGDKYNAALVYANLENNSQAVEKGIKEILREENPYIDVNSFRAFLSLDMDVVKVSRSFMASGVSVMMMAFAAIIVVVCLIVVKFRIGNSIEEDMGKIGSLKAVGYTSSQIISSVVAQFSLIALIGSMAGIILSYQATPALSRVFAHQSGLKWVQGFDATVSSISLLVILFVVLFVSSMASWRIKRLNPIVALRGGITTHSFRRNYMPLNKSKGSLPIVLAMKLMLQNKRQSIMIGVIFIAVSFASAFALVIFYNSAINTQTFAEVPGVELSDVIAIIDPRTDVEAAVANIRGLRSVRNVQFLDTSMLNLEDHEAAVYVMDDYSNKETNTVYEGRYPLHGNEVVISGYLANKLEKRIGDSVILEIGDRQAEYMITGYSQGSYLGRLSIVSITRDGILHLDPGFKQQNLHIYINQDVKSSEFVVELKELYGDSLIETIDMDKEFKQGLALYTSIVSKVGIAIMAVTILVVMLVLYFVINSSVIRKKHELGIQKAFGFTTLQLMNQLSLGLMPPIVVGVTLGSLLGMTQTNAIMTLTQKTMGIMRANYIITPLWITLFGAGILIVSYSISMLITYRIRKISAYELVNE